VCLQGIRVVVVWPEDARIVEIGVDRVVDGVGDDISAGLDPFEAGQRSSVQAV